MLPALASGQSSTQAMASSKSLARMMLNTGPKISSLAMVMEGVTSSKMVGPIEAVGVSRDLDLAAVQDQLGLLP